MSKNKIPVLKGNPKAFMDIKTQEDFDTAFNRLTNEDKAQYVADVAKGLEGQITAYTTYKSELNKEQKDYKAQSEKLKPFVGKYMEQNGITELKGDGNTIKGVRLTEGKPSFVKYETILQVELDGEVKDVKDIAKDALMGMLSAKKTPTQANRLLQELVDRGLIVTDEHEKIMYALDAIDTSKNKKYPLSHRQEKVTVKAVEPTVSFLGLK